MRAASPACVFFTDSTYAIAIAKAKKMKEVIEALGGTTVEWVDTPIAETSQRMPQLTTSLLQRTATSGPTRWPSTISISTSWAHRFQPLALKARASQPTSPPVTVLNRPTSACARASIRQ